MAEQHIYIDSGADPGGDGSYGSPYDLPGDINWTTGGANSIFDWVAAGHDPFINFAGGSSYTSGLWIGTSGVEGHPITVQPYGSGDKPSFSKATSPVVSLWQKSYIDFDELEFNVGDDDDKAFYGNIVHHINLTNSNFPAGTGKGAVFRAANGTDVHHINVLGCTFDQLTSAPVMFNMEEGAGGGEEEATFRQIRVANNRITDCWSGVEFVDVDEWARVNDCSPYDIDIDSNYINKTTRYWIRIRTGTREGYANYIRRNECYDSSTVEQADVNAFQLSWVRDLIIEENYLDGVVTDDPDGCAIILDWGYKVNECLSNNCTVRRNRITGCLSTWAGKGITIYKGTNCKVYENLCWNNGANFKIASAESTGNVFYNNVGYAATRRNVEVSGGAAASIWKNNILHTAPYGMYITPDATAPTEENNCLYNHSTADMWLVGTGSQTPHATDVLADPKMVNPANNIYKLNSDSPCIDAGVDVGLTEDFDKRPVPQNEIPDIGAYEYGGVEAEMLLPVFAVWKRCWTVPEVFDFGSETVN